MKKFLPQTSRNPQGFTLVELLIVITIIAVLAVIGVTVYSGTQKTARDSRRRADIDAISSALEAHYNTTANQYCAASPAGTYCAPVDSLNWFASGFRPTDPATNAQYTGQPTNGATTYNICATLEAGGTFCRANQQ